MMMNKVLLWDFDGTLGHREGGMWGASMLEALKEQDSGTTLTAPHFRPFLVSGFPWHHPELEHTHLTSSEAWWEPIIHKFVQAFEYYGIRKETAVELALSAKEKFLDLNRWRLFEDTTETLIRLSEKGWRHVVVSNHVPELTEIMKHIGLLDNIQTVINSAVAGYEKPNRKIFEYALRQTGAPDTVWMIGDNVEADYFGAEAAGIKAILVRNIDDRAQRNCKNLWEVIRMIEA